MPSGTVSWYNRQKGRGYITPDDPAPAGAAPALTERAHVFVYVSALERAGINTLHEGQRLSYEIEPGDAGWNGATHLRMLPQ